MPYSAVVLETDRLILRPPQQADFDDIHAMWSDINVVRHVTGNAFTKEEAWARLLRSAGHWSLMGFGYWVVSEKRSGKFVGEVGFGQFKRGIDPAFDEAPEIGWMLTAESQGQGYGTEAVRAALRWADTLARCGDCLHHLAGKCALSCARQKMLIRTKSRDNVQGQGNRCIPARGVIA